MRPAHKTEFVAADVLDLAPANVRYDFCRVVGIEYRDTIDDKADADLLMSHKQRMEAIIAYHIEEHGTTMEAVQVDLDQQRAGTRQHLVTLSGYRNITHATLSAHGSNEEVLLCFTEIVGGRTAPIHTAGPMGARAHGSAGGMSTNSNSFTNVSLDGTTNTISDFNIVGDESRQSRATTNAGVASREIPIFKMTLHFVGSTHFRDVTSDANQELSNTLRGYKNNNICQRAYFIRQSKPRSQLYMLVSYDYVSLAIYQVGFKPSKSVVGFEFSPMGQGLAGRHLWHHWCPLTQRVSFWVYRQTYELRVMRISSSGVPTPIFQMADSKRGKVDPIPFSPPPNPCLPWGAGNSSLNSNFSITMVPIVYESAGDKPMRDVAMCYQKLVNTVSRSGANLNTTSSMMTNYAATHKVSFQCSIYLLQNWLHNISLVFDVDIANVPQTACLRASFICLEGLIAIIVPGVFVHFVDVAHYDQPPRYMFGIDLIAHKNAAAREAARNANEGGGLGGTRGSVGNFSPQPSSPASLATSLSNTHRASGGLGLLQQQQSSASNATSPAMTFQDASFTTNSAIMFSTSSVGGSRSFNPTSHGIYNAGIDKAAATNNAMSFVASIFNDFSSQAFPMIPHRHGNWMLSTDSTRLVRVSLSKANLWRWIREGTAGVERFGVHNAIHIASTHFDAGAGGSNYHAFITNNSEPDRHGIRTVLDLLEDGHTAVTPSVLCQVLIGETYNEVRRACRAKQIPFWQHIPMSDDHGLAELEELKYNHRQVTAISDRPNRAWVKDICKRTNDDWWLQGDEVKRTSLFGLLKKKNVTPMHRFSLTGGIVRTAHNHSYYESIKRILLDLEVPKDSADLIATIYNKTLDGYVRELLKAEGKNITPQKKLHFLFNMRVALLALDFPAPDTFEKQYTDLALQLLPPSAIYESVKGKMLSPSLRGLLKHYDCLQTRVNDAARDTGFCSQHLPIMSIGSYDPASASHHVGLGGHHSNSSPNGGGSSSGAAPYGIPGGPNERELAYALEGLEDLCPQVMNAEDYALFATSTVAVASPGVTSDEKHALIAAIQPEPVLQSYRRHFPLDTDFGKYLPLNLFVDSPLARESRLVAFNETELHVKRERAQLVMQEALYPLLVESQKQQQPSKTQSHVRDTYRM